MISRSQLNYISDWSKKIREKSFKSYRNILINDIYSKPVALKLHFML